MGIGAGVMMIVVAAVNLAAAFGYILGIGVVSAFRTAFGGTGTSGLDESVITAYGVFLLVSAGLDIAAGIQLFMNRGKAFVVSAAVIMIAVEAGSMIVRSNF